MMGKDKSRNAALGCGSPRGRYTEDATIDVNPDSLDFWLASGLFAGLRAWNDSTAEILRLSIRYQGQVALNIPEESVT